MNYNSQNNAQFAFNPFQKVAIDMIADRSQGAFFPELEGDHLYFETCDMPYLVSLVTPQTNVLQTFAVREGLQIDASFKGLYITHPAYTRNSGATQSYKTLFHIGKGTADLTNSLNQPTWGAPASILGTYAAALVSGQIAIPAGARMVRALEISFLATTVTQAFWTVSSDGNAELCFSPSVGAFITANPLAGNFRLDTAVGGTFKCVDNNIALPQSARVINYSIVGTVMSQGAGGSVRELFE